MTAVDDDFVRTVVSAADAAAARLLNGDVSPLEDAPLGPHRESMRRVKLLVAVYLAPTSTHEGAAAALASAEKYAHALQALQSPSGLFLGGDNAQSPPDSGFTINDLGDVLELLRQAGVRPELAEVTGTLADIADRAIPAMLTGGVHTPNHRWELAAALTRLYRFRPDPAVLERVEQWLAEGIDIDADGLYSERSPNYAVFVTNPSLLAIADVLDRPGLRDIVEQSLASTLGLIHADGSVETVQSRRQDQKELRFPLAPYALHYRRFAIERGRADFASAARLALSREVAEPQTALTDLLLHPALATPLPDAETAMNVGRTRWVGSGLAIDVSDARTLTVYGGSDYAAFGRIRSGLANNPTFLRMSAGPVVLDSVRLSRDFFGLGPFRADGLEETAEGFILHEVLTPGYYQPLPRDDRHPEGRYEISDEGRFAAAMSFPQRPVDIVSLRTRVDVTPRLDGVDLVIDTVGPECAWSLELAFRDGGAFEGVENGTDGTLQFGTGPGRYRIGDAAIEFAAAPVHGGRGGYVPGEDYTYLGGTDAMIGPRVYLSGRTPGRSVVTIRAVS